MYQYLPLSPYFILSLFNSTREPVNRTATNNSKEEQNTKRPRKRMLLVWESTCYVRSGYSCNKEIFFMYKFYFR